MPDMWLEEDMEHAVQTIREGGILVYPTDTIWGVGCNALDKEAVERVYSLKQRPRDKPMVLVVSSISMLKEHVDDIHPRVETLLTVHERPLTVVYPKASGLPDYLKSEEGTVAIRVILEPFCRELIERCGVPLVSTSANRSGERFPTHFNLVDEVILDGADYVCRYRQDDDSEHVPSVIATYNNKGQLDFLRT